MLASSLLNLIDIKEQDIANISLDLLNILLFDKTMKSYIKWATSDYAYLGDDYSTDHEIIPERIIGNFTEIIQPRVSKSTEEQLRRTKVKAEVFTPSWFCNKQNNLIDDAWFGRTDVFNIVSSDNSWKTTSTKIEFPDGKDWKEYVDCNRLEMSCGEAPYTVSRYDAVSGEYIPVKDRIGFLDRKLRIINENVDTEDEWLKWVIRAYHSTYAFDYQGDNILIARENLLLTFSEYMFFKFSHEPTLSELKKIANIIAWNVWQMDGITMTVPFSSQYIKSAQTKLFPDGNDKNELMEKTPAVPCKIYDWRKKESRLFSELLQGVCS